MKQILTLLAAVLLLPFISLAQSNYRNGYVVNLKGDTIKGYIDYQEWDANPSAINFKTTLNDASVSKYTPTDISYFNVEGIDAYREYTGKITTDFIDPNHLPQGEDTSFAIRSVFLKVLQTGKNVDYYSYTDDIKTRLYVEQTDNKVITELIFHTYRDANNNTGADNTYMKQLFALANKYDVFTSSLQYDIEHLSYTKENILDVISKINGQSGKTLKAGKSGSAVFASAGLHIAHIAAGGRYQINGGKDYNSVLPKISIGYDVYINPNTQKLVFRGELGLQGLHYMTNYNDKVYPYSDINYTYSAVIISFTPQVIYNLYSSSKFKFYLGAGAFLTYSKYFNSHYVSPSGQTENDGINPFSFISMNAQALVQAGVKLNNRVGINVSYITTNGTTDDTYFIFNTSAFQLGVQYYFGKRK